jgi:hypothetical protein
MYSLIRPFRTGFSADPLGGEVGGGDAGSVAFVVGDAFRDAWCGRVVVLGSASGTLPVAGSGGHMAD